MSYPEVFDEGNMQEAFVEGAQSCREFMARFVEQGGDAATAASIRANWNLNWGSDPGPVTGDISIDPWGLTQEFLERNRRAALTRLSEARATLTKADIREWFEAQGCGR